MKQSIWITLLVGIQMLSMWRWDHSSSTIQIIKNTMSLVGCSKQILIRPLMQMPRLLSTQDWEYMTKHKYQWKDWNLLEQVNIILVSLSCLIYRLDLILQLLRLMDILIISRSSMLCLSCR
jgi:hypothetical protein